MNFTRALQITALLTSLGSVALAEDSAPKAVEPTALPSLPLFELPAQASDTARQHVALAHARRDSRRAEHGSHASSTLPPNASEAGRGPGPGAAAASHRKSAPTQLAAARARWAAAQQRRDEASLRKADGQEHRDAAAERRAEAQERRAAAAAQRDAAAARAAELRAAAEQRRAGAAGR